VDLSGREERMQRARPDPVLHAAGGSTYILADARALVIGVLGAVAVVNPSFGLRGGALLSFGVLLSNLVRLRITGSGLWAILYAVTAILSAGWSNAAEWSGIANVVACVTLFLAAQTSIQRRRDVFIVCGGIIAGSIVGVVRILLGDNADIRWSYVSEAARIGLANVNVNATAYSFVTSAALLTIFIHVSRFKVGALMGSLACGLLLYVGILLNGTRGALIGFVALLVWLGFTRINGVMFDWLLGAFVVGSAIVSMGILEGWISGEAGGGTARTSGDLSGRLALWPLARRAIVERPILGHGVDSFQGMNSLGSNAHNWALDVTVSVGLLGLFLFVGVLYLAVVVEPRGWRDPRRTTVVGAYIIVSTPILLTGFWIQSSVFWLSLAIISRLAVVESKGSVPERHVGGNRFRSAQLRDSSLGRLRATKVSP
jgi:hypothetical protein